jgi:hypothetical protein
VAVNVYFSRSFAPNDEKVYKAIRTVIEAPQLKNAYDLNLFDSVKPKAKNLAARITADITQADVVVCVFTRRHKIGSAKYTAPAYIGSEAAYAHGHRKALVLFLESGIDPAEMGLVSGLNLVHVPFDRRQLDSGTFTGRATDYVRSVLDEGVVAPPPHHIFRRYELHHTVYPNGFSMAHYKIKVEVLEDEPISHSMAVTPPDEAVKAGFTLPPPAQLEANAIEAPCAYPTKGFVAFDSPHQGVTFTQLDAEPFERHFEVRFPKAGEVYEYQWMWGSPYGFQPSIETDWFGVLVSHRVVERVDLLLRIHRAVKRKGKPALLFLAGDRKLPFPDDAELAKLRTGGTTHGPTAMEHTPIFRCYRFVVAPVSRGLNFLLVY